MRIDARIPIVFAPVEPRTDDHVVTEAEDFAATPVHDAGCACCAPRSEVAGMLGGLFFARARGEVAFFRRVVVVVVTEEGRGVVEDALEGDAVVSGVYRI